MPRVGGLGCVEHATGIRQPEQAKLPRENHHEPRQTESQLHIAVRRRVAGVAVLVPQSGGRGIPEERRSILHSYIEPTEEDQETPSAKRGVIEGTVARSALASAGGIRCYPGTREWNAMKVPGGARFGPLMMVAVPDLEWTLEVDLGRPPKTLPQKV